VRWRGELVGESGDSAGWGWCISTAVENSIQQKEMIKNKNKKHVKENTEQGNEVTTVHRSEISTHKMEKVRHPAHGWW
jgi:hypothetical protein